MWLQVNVASIPEWGSGDRMWFQVNVASIPGWVLVRRCVFNTRMTFRYEDVVSIIGWGSSNRMAFPFQDVVSMTGWGSDKRVWIQ